ncbi:MAG: carboxypeptidase-like regulatory domain-containing protein [Chlorobi bacterium]|nr:carboxypeptidase-like regulatory domain-containing protein [Chlorobiota bacterium]
MRKRFCIIKLWYFIIVFFLTVFTGVISAQSDSLVLISGRIVESDKNEPVPYAYVASYSLHLMFSSDSLGRFYIELPSNDSIKIVMMGFESRVVKIDSALYESTDDVIIKLQRSSIMLSNVDVNLRRSLFSIDPADKTAVENFNADNLNLPSDIILYDKSKDVIPASVKPVFKQKPPVVVFFFHPVSYVNYFAGKRERSKRKMVKLIYSEKADSVLTRALIAEISGFQGDSLEKFIIFCNRNIKTSINDDESSIRQKVFFALEMYIRKE